MWGTWRKLLKNKLERFQSRAATDVPGASYHVLTVDLINSLSSDTLDARRRYAKSFLKCQPHPRQLKMEPLAN